MTPVLGALHGVVDILAALQAALQQGAMDADVGDECIGDGVQKAGKGIQGDMDRVPYSFNFCAQLLPGLEISESNYVISFTTNPELLIQNILKECL